VGAWGNVSVNVVGLLPPGENPLLSIARKPADEKSNTPRLRMGIESALKRMVIGAIQT